MGYAEVIMSQTPAWYYKLEEESGLPQDASGNARHAVSVNGSPVRRQPGIEGRHSFGFDGTDDFVTSGWDYAGGVFVMSAWVRPTGVTSTDLNWSSRSTNRWAIYPTHKGASPNAGLGFAVGTNGILVAEHGDAHGYGAGFYTATIPSDRFSHVALRYNNTSTNSYDLFVHGIKVATYNRSRSAIYSSQHIGGGSNGGMDGWVDEPAVFASALTDAQITKQAAVTPAQPNPVKRMFPAFMDKLSDRTILGTKDRFGTPYVSVGGSVAINTTENAMEVPSPAGTHFFNFELWGGTKDHDAVPAWDLFFERKGGVMDFAVNVGTAGWAAYLYGDNGSGWLHLRSNIGGSDAAIIGGTNMSDQLSWQTYRLTFEDWVFSFYYKGVLRGTYTVPFNKRVGFAGRFRVTSQSGTSYYRNLTVLSSAAHKGVSY